MNNLASPDEKIALFAGLFRGRPDVYPLRFESRKTGRAGYQPACGNEWVRGICEKPRVKCHQCPHQRFLPVSNETVRWHLSGHDDTGASFVMGVYPMLLDETCWLLAIDFDGEGWQEDVQVIVGVCRQLDLPMALERSRSGNGAHAWFFFAEPLPATLARKLGSSLLTRTMEMRPELGLASYDRLFPNQDTLPQGGLGNLIALPLQKGPRELGHTLFLDDQLAPHEDQWAFLASVGRLTRERVETLVREAERDGEVIGVRLVPNDEEEPWKLPPSRRVAPPEIKGPMPDKLEIILGGDIYIPKEQLPPPLRNRLVRLAAFQNPEFYRAQAMRLPVFSKPRIIGCAEDHGKYLALPRGCLEEVEGLLRSLGIRRKIRDEREKGQPLEVSFAGTLRPEQQQAGEKLLQHDTGVLAATTAFGKTVLAAWLIARRCVNTLVLVHRQQLLEQWIERLSAFLDIPASDIGRVGGGRKELNGRIDVALIQSLVRKEMVNDCVANYGHLVVDECHHISARSFELVTRRARARYITGLSATVARKDGHHPIIFMQCGPVRHRVDGKQQAEARPFTHHVHVRPTGFRDSAAGTEPEQEIRREFARSYAALVACDERTRMICDDVVAAVHEGRSPLVLTERTEHLELLAERLHARVHRLIVLKGGLGKRGLRAALDQVAALPAEQPRVVLATGRYIGEGFDDPRLDTLFLTMPISWRGTVAQYAGRLHRLHEGKREVRIVDYADLDVPMFARMFNRRCAAYEAAGYTILLPASALPGWPPQVPLPIDPAWKRDYAASIRRLIRDGVDIPLAELFTRAARPSMETGGHARSAAEAFLHHRLESLPATRGRFLLNASLPIPFDSWSAMEVDFSCQEARLAIELDGPQHLDGADAYRSDRRKDALLQEHGWFVLRFLAEDVSKQLDHVLDTILRALAHQERAQKSTARECGRTARTGPGPT